MASYALQKKVNECYAYADMIQIQGYGPSNQMTMREMLKFDFLQFIGFLFEPNGSDMRDELRFIQDYLTTYMTNSQFVKFRYDRCMTPDFINTVPRSLTYFAKADLSGISVRTNDGLSKTRFVVETFAELGREFAAVNSKDSSVTSVSNLTNYTLMLEKFLKKYGLYISGAPGTSISAETLKNSRIRPNSLSGVINNGVPNTGANTVAGRKIAATNNAAGNAAKPAPSVPEEKTLEQCLEELNSLTGLDAVKQDIRNLINLIKVKKLREERGMKQPSISLHLVFSGNPGTGKTTVARLLAGIYQKLGVASTGQLVEVDRSGLVEGYVGQTAIKTMEVIESALGGILFIDEAYTLTSNKGEKDFGQEAVDTLLKAMEDHRDDLIVIVAGYTDKMEEFVNSNPGLKSRFNKYIFFKDYTGPELYNIFESLCVKQEYVLDKEAADYVRDYLELRATSHEENFANAREVRNYIERCIQRQATRIVGLDNIDDTVIKTFVLDDVKEVPEDIANVTDETSTETTATASEGTTSDADDAKVAENKAE